MKNIWTLFVNDLKRLTSNVVTIIIVVGLIAIPSIFSWYNILACWDVFNNTGQLTVAVANSDEGYESDLIPLEVNIGEQVVSTLRANDQLNWVFTTEEDAIDGTKSGKYYAAVVIPASFSQDMMTFYSEDAEHAQITYYTNEKKSAVAPKITDQGADTVAYEINEAFTETLSNVALALATGLSEYADEADVDSRIGDVADSVDELGEEMSHASDVLSMYSQLLGSAQQLVDSSSQLLKQSEDAVAELDSATDGSTEAVSSISGALDQASSALKTALDQSSNSFAAVPSTINSVYDSAGALSSDAATQLRDQAGIVGDQVSKYQDVITRLQQLRDLLPTDNQTLLDTFISRLTSSMTTLQQLQQKLLDAASDVEQGNADAQAQKSEIESLAYQAQSSISQLASDYESNIKPGLDSLASEVSSLATKIDSRMSQLDDVAANLEGDADSVSQKLTAAKQKIDDAAAELSASATDFTDLAARMKAALASGDLSALSDVIGSDPESLATALAAPVGVERTAVFPVENFGSAMSPLYTTLGLWVGALLMVVAVKVNVSERSLAQLNNPKQHQTFLGRFGVFAVLSLAQSTCVCVGNMFFMRLQVNEPLLYLLCFWTAGLVFTFIVYTLVVSFANLGKAVAVLVLIIQVTAGGGSFPLQLLPEAFQMVSPFLPATHVINAMRAAMMGVYQNDYWYELGTLLLFVVPFALLGLLLRKPLIKFMNWYVAKVESSKLVA